MGRRRRERIAGLADVRSASTTITHDNATKITDMKTKTKTMTGGTQTIGDDHSSNVSRGKEEIDSDADGDDFNTDGASAGISDGTSDVHDSDSDTGDTSDTSDTSSDRNTFNSSTSDGQDSDSTSAGSDSCERGEAAKQPARSGAVADDGPRADGGAAAAPSSGAKAARYAERLAAVAKREALRREKAAANRAALGTGKKKTRKQARGRKNEVEGKAAAAPVAAQPPAGAGRRVYVQFENCVDSKLALARHGFVIDELKAGHPARGKRHPLNMAAADLSATEADQYAELGPHITKVMVAKGLDYMCLVYIGEGFATVRFAQRAHKNSATNVQIYKRQYAQFLHDPERNIP